jgi:DNA-binding response OmpR family regulator
LVEDEPPAAEMLAKGLREQSFAVDIARDGAAALYQASTNDYDVILLDINLPLKNGLEVCRELRADGSTVPVLMLTARDDVQDRIAGLDTGADDYLTKPYAFHELLARVRAITRRGPAFSSDLIEVGDLRMDRKSRKVNRAGSVIGLTAKEYALLIHSKTP